MPTKCIIFSFFVLATGDEIEVREKHLNRGKLVIPIALPMLSWGHGSSLDSTQSLHPLTFLWFELSYVCSVVATKRICKQVGLPVMMHIRVTNFVAPHKSVRRKHQQSVPLVMRLKETNNERLPNDLAMSHKIPSFY